MRHLLIKRVSTGRPQHCKSFSGVPKDDGITEKGVLGSSHVMPGTSLCLLSLKVPGLHHPGPETQGSPRLLQDYEGRQDRHQGEHEGQVHRVGAHAARQGQGKRMLDDVLHGFLNFFSPTG